MKKNYDFSSAQTNPYAKRLKKQLTIRMDPDTLQYFQNLAGEFAIPYQTLMNMYLRECAALGLRPAWLHPPGPKTKSVTKSSRPTRRAS